MPRRPAVRANNARDSFAFFARAYPALHLHLKQALPADAIARIENGVRTDWIPVESDGLYVDAVFQHLGHAEGQRAYRRFLVEDLVKSPMMRSMFDGVLRLFGVSVGGFLRVLPSALSQSYRDAFTLTIDRGEREARLSFDDIAPEILRFSAYPLVWEAVFLGVYDLARKEPQLDFKLSRPQRRVDAHFRW